MGPKFKKLGDSIQENVLKKEEKEISELRSPTEN